MHNELALGLRLRNRFDVPDNQKWRRNSSGSARVVNSRGPEMLAFYIYQRPQEPIRQQRRRAQGCRQTAPVAQPVAQSPTVERCAPHL
jgi:hypothetical protein